MRAALLSLGVLTACAPPPPEPEVPHSAVAPCFTLDRTDFDFGEATGRVIGRFTLTNPGAVPVNIGVSQPRSPFHLELPVGAFVGEDLFSVAPGTAQPLVIIFDTRDALLHLDQLELKDVRQVACTKTLKLRGLGAGEVTTTETLDFGNVDLGTEKTLTLELRNATRAPVQVRSLDVVNGDPDVFVAQRAAPFTLEPLGVVLVPVVGRATAPRAFSGVLSVGLSTKATPALIPLSLVVGTPRAELEGVPLVIPELGLRPGANPPSFAVRHFRLRNTGTGGAPEAALRLVPPFMEFAADPGAGAPQLIVEGVFAADAGSSMELGLAVLPDDFGPHTWHVKLFTNAPQRLEFDVSTNAVALPDCTLDVLHDAQLDVPADGGVATFTLRNTGTTRCVLDHLVLRAPANTFAVVDGGFEQRALLPGEAHGVQVISLGPVTGASSLRYLVFGAPQLESTVTLNRR